MAEEKEPRSWWKAVSSSVVGLFSGAVLMYVSPLVNSAIKPPRPVPNFAYSAEGALVTFTNRSTGGTQGWWDFGDGSALEPFSPSQGAITHRFPGAGSYPVKLSLSNLIGEANERSVTVRVDAAASPQPEIEALEIQPYRKSSQTDGRLTAPATVRVVARIKNADLAIWCADDLPIEIVSDPSGQLEHNFTFAYYGSKKVRLMAVNSNGRSRVEKEADVWVEVPAEEPRILVYPEMVRGSKKSIPVSVSIPPNFTGDAYPFDLARSVQPDEMILGAELDEAPSPDLVRKQQLRIAPDRKSVHVRGELVRPAGGGVPPSWFGRVELKVGSRTAPRSPQSAPAESKLELPGKTYVALPAGASAQELEWELRQGMTVVMKETKVPVAQVVQFGGKPYRVAVHQEGTQIVIEAREEKSTPALSTSSKRSK